MTSGESFPSAKDIEEQSLPHEVVITKTDRSAPFVTSKVQKHSELILLIGPFLESAVGAVEIEIQRYLDMARSRVDAM